MNFIIARVCGAIVGQRRFVCIALDVITAELRAGPEAVTFSVQTSKLLKLLARVGGRRNGVR